MFQSPERKKATKRYCRRHKHHYHLSCVYCDVENYRKIWSDAKEMYK